MTDKSSDKQRRAAELHAEGLSFAAIGREVGESRQVVWQWLKGRARPRVISDKSKATRREYMRGYMKKKRTDARVARLLA